MSERVIKYRGKIDGEWLYITPDDISWGMFWLAVDRSTVGQFIGLKDNQGHEIFEGDILKLENGTAKVVYWTNPPEFGLDYYHNEDEWSDDWNLSDDSERMEIIGNIYDHPHLLQGA